MRILWAGAVAVHAVRGHPRPARQHQLPETPGKASKVRTRELERRLSHHLCLAEAGETVDIAWDDRRGGEVDQTAAMSRHGAPSSARNGLTIVMPSMRWPC